MKHGVTVIVDFLIIVSGDGNPSTIRRYIYIAHPVILETVLHQTAFDLLSQTCEIVRSKGGIEGTEVARKAKAQAAIVVFWQINGDVLDQIPSLLVVGRPGIGVDNIDLEAATARGVCVVNTPDASTASTAEQTVGLLLALAKRHKAAVRLLATSGRFLALVSRLNVVNHT